MLQKGANAVYINSKHKITEENLPEIKNAEIFENCGYKWDFYEQFCYSGGDKSI